MEQAIQIKNAYAVLKQTYQEVSHLLQDFGVEIKKKGFIHAHSGVECELSRQLSRSNRWIPPWFTLYFYLRSDKECETKNFLGVSVIFRDHSGEAITPKLLLGIIPNFDTHHRWWISSMYASEEMKLYTTKEGVEIHGNTLPDDYLSNWMKISFEGKKPDKNWYDPGYLFAKELVEIKNRKTINKLAEKLNEKYCQILV